MPKNTAHRPRLEIPCGFWPFQVHTPFQPNFLFSFQSIPSCPFSYSYISLFLPRFIICLFYLIAKKENQGRRSGENNIWRKNVELWESRVKRISKNKVSKQCQICRILQTEPLCVTQLCFNKNVLSYLLMFYYLKVQIIFGILQEIKKYFKLCGGLKNI